MTSTAPVVDSTDFTRPGKLPTPRGPLSEAVVDALRGDPATSITFPVMVDDVDPLGGDAQLALYVCYELHYRGFDGVDDDWEWNTDILGFRRVLERRFLSCLRAFVEPGDDAVAEMDALSIEPKSGTGPSWYLRDHASWAQMQEYLANRSLYHLKEADPHAFAIPRLTGQAKASFVAVEYDEYGAGKGNRLHQQLFADAMRAADMDTAYLAYIDTSAAEMLAVVNVMSLFGLHRSLRGAAVGHFAATEITSSPGAARLVDGMKRLGAPEPCVHFYAEHVEADAVHEQILRHDVVGTLIAAEPELEKDVVFGMRALDFVEERFADAMIRRWNA
ncbi:iron-containing redox enzyme family protein [Rhodococcoides kyotonense]|uniref:Iron-containing redox enzyme n=1 Tax=Rhodococcoides kyotonense TaxID=398843 RepID=A0A239DZ84_9NOCA|nr:iron-containing redox enzyme family protein [Rhodococcus kyotonensis]SNS37033.1 Iron-containing redox enzyme [Rhodococcus kyotonensis]